jgi:formamidopyrimidine-DNA glycosylase
VPELPEVETVRLGLNQVTLHQTLEGGQVLLDRTIAHPLDVGAFLAGIQGCQIAQWHRRGKYLYAELVAPQDAGTSRRASRSNSRIPAPRGYLGAHLRMTGQLLWMHQSDPLQKHTRVRLFFPAGRELRFNDQRTFGQLWWVPAELGLEQVMTGLQKLGPEPFSAEFCDRYLIDAFKGRQRPIKNALLDQSLVAGVGNIYADEALFLSQIRPETLCAKLKPSQIKTLRQQVISVLQASIAARGTSFSDYRDISGTNGNYGAIAWVYGRDGQPCRVCGTEIIRVKLAGRSAHFCPQCQPSA